MNYCGISCDRTFSYHDTIVTDRLKCKQFLVDDHKKYSMSLSCATATATADFATVHNRIKLNANPPPPLRHPLVDEWLVHTIRQNSRNNLFLMKTSVSHPAQWSSDKRPTHSHHRANVQIRMSRNKNVNQYTVGYEDSLDVGVRTRNPFPKYVYCHGYLGTCKNKEKNCLNANIWGFSSLNSIFSRTFKAIQYCVNEVSSASFHES